MRFRETPLPDLLLVLPEPHADERGLFARSWCQREWEEQGLDPRIVQCNISFNHRRGTVRGLHFQIPPWPEPKLVRCTAGAIWDVAVDLRPGSQTRGHHFAVELTAAARNALWIPEGFAHGFQTLTDAAEVFYQMAERYHPEAARGIRWDDPELAIPWPLPVSNISERDRELPGWAELAP